jgi:capsular exopolysaccharide synthesis family protein
MRKLRTTLLVPGVRRVGSILVTSAMAGDGKSLASLNLAVSLAQTGARTLLVNADLRRPRLDEMLGLKGARGLSEAIQSHSSPTRILPLGALRQLSFVPAGRVPSAPAELLGSAQVRDLLLGWQTHYDYVVIDSAPLMAVADPLLLVPWVDGCLLVVRQGKTPRAAAEESCAMLARHLRSDAAFGVVLNAVPVDRMYAQHASCGAPRPGKNDGFHA